MDRADHIVDRVARAIHDSYSEPEHGEGWAGLSDGWREHHRELARLMLRAIREPTLPMLARGTAARNAEDCWRLMIDEALRPSPLPQPREVRQGDDEDGRG